MGLSEPKIQARSLRTEILFDDGGILKIYHLGRKATESEVRSGGLGIGKGL
jgi:hypothetical protein